MSLTRDDWLSLQSSQPSTEALNALLLPCTDIFAADGRSVQVIVGGGMAGLLLALRVSRQETKNKLILLESRATLGGRLFQSPPASVGMSRVEALKEQFSEQALQHCSGPGFEIFDPITLEIYERHLRMNLDDHEIDFIDAFVSERNLSQENFLRKTFLTKKEITSLSDVLADSSEILTRKEAETLQLIAQPENISPENDGPWESSSFWTALPKVQKEALTPVFETLLGWPLDRTPTSVLRSVVHAFVKSHDVVLLPWFVRRARLELALEVILLARGVAVCTQAELVRALPSEKKGDGTILQIADHYRPTPHWCTVNQVAFALPLMKVLTLFSREQLHPQHSKVVARHRPRSLVWVEYDHWRQALVRPADAEVLRPGSRFVFSVERVQGICLSQGRLGFYTSIDFEDSLHAQSVREALHRCRKAALRLLSEPHMKAAQQARPAAPGIQLMRERISLMPVGYQLPRNEAVPTVIEVKMSPQGWYSLGDHFTFGPEAWKNVVESVHAVVPFFCKETSRQ